MIRRLSDWRKIKSSSVRAFLPLSISSVSIGLSLLIASVSATNTYSAERPCLPPLVENAIKVAQTEETRAVTSLAQAIRNPLNRDTAAFFLNELRRDREQFFIRDENEGPSPEVTLKWNPKSRTYSDPRAKSPQTWTLEQLNHDLASSRVLKRPNPIGIENYAHIRRLYTRMLRHHNELVSAHVSFDDLISGVLASDLGKTRLKEIIELYRSGDLEIPGVQRDWKETDFFAAFMRHEDYGIALMKEFMFERGRLLGLPESEIQTYYQNAVDAVRGHNGPATPHSFWKHAHESLGLGPYADPTLDREVWVHAIADRADGVQISVHTAPNGTREISGGPRKILNELLKNSKDLRSFAEKVTEAFFTNPKGTLEQMNHLTELAQSNPAFEGLDLLPYSRECFMDALKTQAQIEKIVRVHGSIVQVKGTGKTWAEVRNADELFKALAEAWDTP